MKPQIFEINVHQNYSESFGWVARASFSVEKYNGTWDNLCERWNNSYSFAVMGVPEKMPPKPTYISAFYNDHAGSREEIGYVVCRSKKYAEEKAKEIAESWGYEEYVSQ